MPRIVYKNAAGTRVPGVTTIGGAYKGDIGGLMGWANKGGLAGKSLDELYDTSTVPGTLVHEMIENTINGRDTDLSPYSPEQVSLAETAYLNWQTWWKTMHIEPILVEPNWVSEEMQCGGTPDLIATANGKRALIDWKSGKPLNYTSTLLQLSAYDMIHDELFERKLEGFYIVCIPRNSETPTFTVQYREAMPQLAKDQFLRLRECYEAEKQLKKML